MRTYDYMNSGAVSLGGQVQFRDKSLHGELLESNYIALLAYGVTGRYPSPEETAVIQGLFVATSYPEWRIWNNRIAALAGTVRSSPGLALGAAIAVSEAALYGGGPHVRLYDYLTQVRARLEAGELLADIVAKSVASGERLAGFGRPVAPDKVDERIAPLKELWDRRGPEKSYFVPLVFDIEVELVKRCRSPIRMNAASVYVSTLMDLGFSREEVSTLLSAVFLAGMNPCYMAASAGPENDLCSMNLDQLTYEGPAPRKWVPLAQRDQSEEPPIHD